MAQHKYICVYLRTKDIRAPSKREWSDTLHVQCTRHTLQTYLHVHAKIQRRGKKRDKNKKKADKCILVFFSLDVCVRVRVCNFVM